VRRSRVVLTPQEQASSWREGPLAMVSKSRSPGRARNKPSSHCAGKAGVSPLHLFARVRHLLCTNAHETAGAARTRSSPRPLSVEARTKLQSSGEKPSREREVMPHRHCEARSDEAIQSSFASLDCFASLAMTARPLQFVVPMPTDIHLSHRYINPARHHVRVFGVGLEVPGKTRTWCRAGLI